MSQPTAVIYARISQDKTGQELGVQRQLDECRALCQQRGFTVLREYVDNDVSATTGRVRPQFEAMLTASDYDVIVVWHTDRLVRLTRELERVIDKACDVHAVQAGHLDLSNPAGRAVAKTITAWAQYEGEQKSARQKLAARQKAVSGRPNWSNRPYGYRMDGTLHPAEAPAVAEAYRRFLDGHPLADIAAWLNTVPGTDRHSFTGPHLSRLLGNPRNAALRAYRGSIVGAASWEPVVSEDVWRAAHSLLTDPQRQAVRLGPFGRHLLTGIITCGVCGHAANAASRKNRRTGERYWLYQCSANSHCASARLAETERLVVAEAVTIAPLFAELQAQQADPSEELAQLQTERAAAVLRADEVATLYGAGELDLRAYSAASRAAQAKLEAIDARIGELSGDRFEFARFDELAAHFAGQDLPSKRRFLSAVFDEVAILPRPKGAQSPVLLRLKPRGFASMDEAVEQLPEGVTDYIVGYLDRLLESPSNGL